MAVITREKELKLDQGLERYSSYTKSSITKMYTFGLRIFGVEKSIV